VFLCQETKANRKEKTIAKDQMTNKSQEPNSKVQTDDPEQRRVRSLILEQSKWQSIAGFFLV
jgi:hypothetical protein